MCGDDAVPLVPWLSSRECVDNGVGTCHNVLFLVNAASSQILWTYLMRKLGPAEDLYRWVC